MQHKVPQDVERADKVLFGMTWTQIIIMIVGGLFDYMLFSVLVKSFHWLVVMIPVAFIGMLVAAFALLKIQDIPLYRFVFVMLEYVLLPKRRFFAPQGVAYGHGILWQAPKPKAPVAPKGPQPQTIAAQDDLLAALEGTAPHRDPAQVATVPDEHLLVHSFVGPVDQTAVNHLESQKKD